MRKGILLALLILSTAAFAGEINNQSDVYDDFRRVLLPPLPGVPVDEEMTALIKRYMASLLYPVDMPSLNRPDKDAKFRDLIIILQQQMGDPPTGVLTTEQFLKLQEAFRYVDGDL